MQQVTDLLNQTGVNAALDLLYKDPYVSAALSLFLLMYAGMAAPQLPDVVLDLFDNEMFRLAVLFLIAYTGNKNPTVSLLSAIAFVMTMNVLNQRKAQEAFRN